MRKRWIVGGIAAAVIVAGVAGLLIVRQVRVEAARCDTIAALNAQLTTPIGTGDPVTVVGDSYAQGYGLKNARQSWVSYLGKRVTVAASSSAGYTRTGLCNSPSIPQLAAHKTGTVIIEGGLNDIDAVTQLEQAAVKTYRSVHGRVIVVGPPLAPGFDAKKVTAADAALSKAALTVGVPYISTLHWKLEYLPGGEHLTPEGHKLFGEKVAAELP